jgi:hypothetical protein
MVECVDRYYEEFKLYLKKTMTPKWVALQIKTIRKRQQILDSTPEEIFSWHLGRSIRITMLRIMKFYYGKTYIPQ